MAIMCFLARNTRAVSLLCAVLTLLVVRPFASPEASGQSQKEIDWVMLLADEPGKELVASWCVGCHSLEKMVIGRKSKDAWLGSVGNMIGEYGAPVSEEDMEAIADYLGRVSGEDNPVTEVPMNVNSAPPEALKRLKFLNKEQIDSIVQHRAQNKFSSLEEVHKLLKLNPDQVELCNTYLRVG